MKKLFFIFLSVVFFASISQNVVRAYNPQCNDFTYFQAHEAECLAAGAADNWGQGGGGTVSTIGDIIGVLSSIVTRIVPFIIGLAVLVILWGLFGYITHAGEEEKRAEARMFIIYGILGLFIMISIWGLVGIVSNTFKIQNRGPQSVGSIFPSN